MVGTHSFACNACGRCCNSSPLMTVPELFRHEDLFIGALGIRSAAQGSIELVTLGLDYPSQSSCPALSDNGGCTLHDSGKPDMCRTVPLDPFVPDAVQHRVLLRRGAAGPDYLGADCIVAGERAGMSVLVRDGAVVDLRFRDQLHSHRGRLADEHAFWGAVIKPALAAHFRAPRPGLTTLPLVPVLSTLSSHSLASKNRCLQYVRRQLALIERQIASAMQRKQASDRPVTAELRNFAAAYVRLTDEWGRAETTVLKSTDDAARIENYLGLG